MAFNEFHRSYDLSQPVDEDMWEIVTNDNWSWDNGRLINRGDGKAQIYLRPCSIYGDRITLNLRANSAMRGVLAFGFQAGFEFIRCELNLHSGKLCVFTHEFHKQQPRVKQTVTRPTRSITLVRERDDLPGLPYDGSYVAILIDDSQVAAIGSIDFLPESLLHVGLNGAGDLNLASLEIEGPKRPRPEFTHIGGWQQADKPTTPQNVNGLIKGIQQAADAGVRILATPETSLTGLRPASPDLDNEKEINAELDRLCKAVAKIKDAPYTLIGYPAWVDGSQVDGSELDRVKINRHVFITPDGQVGPPMAKVHSCEHGLWHGRSYNLQRVDGVEVAVGICHDGHYQDVWATGVMGGARLCIHAAAGGTTRKGKIADLRKKIVHNPGTALESFWMHVNAYGPTTIYRPTTTARHHESLIAVCEELTKANPTYPEYSPMGDQLTHAKIRLWDATGAFPMRTLRSGKTGYENWSKLVPEIVEIQQTG